MNIRDLNLQLKGNTKLPVSNCVKTMEPSSSLNILYPAVFHFKEERVLAVHPPSCHPRRVFGYPKNGKKMRESEAKEKEVGALKASPPKIYCIK